MGLPALKEQFELLAAETQTRSQDVSRAAEVVSITMGKLVRAVNSLTETLHELRVLLLTGGTDLRDLFDKLDRDEKSACDLAGCASVMAMMKRFRRRIGRPYFEDVDGSSFVKVAGRMEQLKTSTAADGRTARRLAKRVREAAEDCERARLRFVVTMDDMSLKLDTFAAKHFVSSDFRRAYAQALAEQSIQRFPVVNAYLAQ